MVRFDAINNPNNVQPSYKFLAVSQGSQCGVSTSAPGVSLASQNAEFAVFRFWFPPTPWSPPIYTTSKWWLESQLNALPTSGTSRIEYFKFERRIKFWGIGFGWKTMNEYSRSNPPSYVGWDGAPGGTESIEGRTDGGLQTGPQATPFYKNWYGFPFASLKAGAGFTINQDLFSFVSTTSALDATEGISLNNAFNYTTNGNANTATFKYITNEKEQATGLFNQKHTDYTVRNAKWIFNEMQNLPQSITCQDYCLDDLKITPDAGICGNSNTYEIANLPPGASVVWSVTPSGIVSTTALNANPITLTKLNEGTITLAANVTLPCSNTPGNTTSTLLFSKVLSVANVGLTGTYVTSQNSSPVSFTGNTGIFVQAQRGQYVSISFNIASTQNLTNLRWSTNFNQISGYGNSFSFGINASNYQYSSTNTNIYLYADSPCGPVTYSFYFTVFSSLRMIVTASPNPASSGEINIAITKEQETATRPANFPPEVKATNPYTKITITPINNNIPAKTLLFREDTNTNYKINTNGLTAGTYAVTVDRNNIITTTKIIVL